jgi:hypothetical protein
VGVAAAWVVAAGALVALMTASMTGWLREPAAETNDVAASYALPEVAAAPAEARTEEARFDEPTAVASEPLAAAPAAMITLDPEPENPPDAEPEAVAIVEVAPDAVIVQEPEPELSAEPDAVAIVAVAPETVIVHEPEPELSAEPDAVTIVAVAPDAVIVQEAEPEPEPSITTADEAPDFVTASTTPVAGEAISDEPAHAPISSVRGGEPDRENGNRTGEQSPAVSGPTPDLEIADVQSKATPVVIARVETTEPEPSTAKQEPAPGAASNAATTEPDLRVREGVLGKGEWLALSLRKHGIPTSVATRIAHEVGSTFDFRYARAGQRYRITQDAAGKLIAFDYEIAPGDDLELRRVGGRYQVTRSTR